MEQRRKPEQVQRERDGWTPLATSAGLLAMPWRWHRRFAARAMPHAPRRPRRLGIGSLALDAGVLATALPAAGA